MVRARAGKFKMSRQLAVAFVVLSAVGCSSVLHSPRNAEVKRKMAQAEYFAGRGNYGPAVSQYEQIIATSPGNPWEDKVLFELGCLYALGDNPDRDFSRSQSCFRRLKEQHPKSRFNSQTRVWLELLETIVSLQSELQAGEADKLSLEQEMARMKAERLERESAWSADTELKARKLKELENFIQTQKTALESLQQQLKKMKEIDIQSEKKAKRIT